MKQAYGDILLKRETVRDEVGYEQDPTYPLTLKSKSDEETEDEVTNVEAEGLKPGPKRELLTAMMCVGFQKRHGKVLPVKCYLSKQCERYPVSNADDRA